MQNISQSSSSSFLYSNQQLEDLLAPFKDPITFEFFVNPVVLRCGHTLEESSAQEIISTAPQRGQRPQCPLDRQPFSSYTPNYALRDAMRGIIAEIQKNAASILPCVTKKIAEETTPIPFPGKEAQFECRTLSIEEDGLYIDLASINPSSYLKEMSVIGCPDGGIAIQIVARISFSHGYLQQVNSEIKKFNDYIRDLGFQPTTGIYFTTRNLSQHRRIFKILAENNQFPEPEFKFIKRLIELNDWRAFATEMRESSSSTASTQRPCKRSRDENSL